MNVLNSDSTKCQINVPYVLIEGLLTVNITNNSRKNIAKKLIDTIFFLVIN